MTWSRFDEIYSDHPKVVAAGPYGELLDMRAIVYCNRWGTDGHVPAHALAVLGRGVPAPARVASTLVDVGRWELATDGWMVHDFLDYNPSRAETEAKRAAKSAAGKKGGEAKARALATAKQPPEQPPDKPVARVRSRTDVLDQVGQHQFGASWRPAEPSVEWARDEGYSEYQVRRQSQRFIARNLEQGTEFRDVEAAWRAWMRREQPERTNVELPALRTTEPCGLCDAPLQPGLNGELECAAGCEAIVIDLASAS